MLLALALLGTLGHAATYVYDGNGRLRAVTAASGESAEYVYDALGNLLAVDRIPAGQLAIFTFTPNHGKVGTIVTVSGQGFSQTAAENLLRFNGIPAMVRSASATRLVAAVPDGATTGPLSVTVGQATATSLEDFILGEDGAGPPPVIEAFSPAVADATTTVTVNGSHFATAAGPVRAGVNESTVFVTPASDTQLAFQVPAQTGSGPVSVTTAYGSARSAESLIVVPTSVGAANVVATATLAVDGEPRTLAIGAAGKYAAASFSGTAGQWLSLQFAGLATTPANGSLTVSLYDRDGVALVTGGSVGPNGLSVHLPALTKSGTFAVLVKAASNMTAQFSLRVESNPALDTSAPLEVSSAIGGQSKRMTFPVAAGENLGLGIRNLVVTDTSSPASTYAYVYVYKPDGSTWVSKFCYPADGGCDVNLGNAPASGTYSAVVRPYPYGTGTLSFTATLSDDLVVPLVANTPASVDLDRNGRNARLTFDGMAGSTVAIQIGGIATTPSGKAVSLTVYKPDGTTWSGQSASPTAAYTFNLANLPATGRYIVYVDPQYGVTASLTATRSP